MFIFFIQTQPTGPKIELDNDLVAPELQKYFDRSYWEQKEKANSAAPAVQSSIKATEPVVAVTAVTTPSAPPTIQSEPSYTSMNNYTEGEVCCVYLSLYTCARIDVCLLLVASSYGLGIGIIG